MNIENRLKLLRSERTKILGFGRSHLRSVLLARKLDAYIDKAVRKTRDEYGTPQLFRSWLWEKVRSRCDDLQRRENFQFRVFDEGALEFLDQDLIKRLGQDVEDQLEVTEKNLKQLPNRARAVLQFFYQNGDSMATIGKRIGVSAEEAYALWQHSLIFLWEEMESGFEGFRERDDEQFWTLALRYLDGTASEKFVAELNREIHVSKSRTKEYNDLRLIDGVLMAFGQTERWPPCPAFENFPKQKQTRAGGLLMPSPPVGMAVSVVGEGAGLFSESEEKPTTETQKTEVEVKEAKPKPKPDEVVEQETQVTENIAPEPKAEPIVAPAEAAPVDEAPVVEVKEQTKPQVAEKSEPVLATENVDQDTRHGVMIDQSPARLPKVRFKLDPVWLKRLGILALAILGGLSLVHILKGTHVQPTILSVKGVPRVLQSVDLNFVESPTFDGYNLQHGNYKMDSGTLKFQTPDSVDILVEAPAEFEIKADNHLALMQGRMVAKMPSKSELEQFVVETPRFKFATYEGEVGFVCDRRSIDLLVFSGEGQLIESEEKTRGLYMGDGLRFFDVGSAQKLIPREEAHRFPESLPVLEPKTYGDNLIVNHSFEVGLLSRSCKTERLYRDIPLGWIAGWQKQGAWQPPMEQHSGTIQLTDAIGGLPEPANGERYLWINHGFVSQPLKTLQAGKTYELSLKIGSHQNFGPAAGHLVRHVGGNMFQFGVWSGESWLVESSGQLETGQAFREMVVEFKCPEDMTEMEPYLMLTGETRIFYDDIQLVEKSSEESAP